jgi:hypothetical protein
MIQFARTVEKTMTKWIPKPNEREKETVESFKAHDISFVAEQDGKTEREFKARLAERFRSNIHVAEAYLVRLRYGDSPEQKVALCLKTDEIPQKEIVDSIGSEFRGMFRTSESLDILFLTNKQQQQIVPIAKPFYRQKLNPA